MYTNHEFLYKLFTMINKFHNIMSLETKPNSTTNFQKARNLTKKKKKKKKRNRKKE